MEGSIHAKKKKTDDRSSVFPSQSTAETQEGIASPPQVQGGKGLRNSPLAKGDPSPLLPRLTTHLARM